MCMCLGVCVFVYVFRSVCHCMLSDARRDTWAHVSHQATVDHSVCVCLCLCVCVCVCEGVWLSVCNEIFVTKILYKNNSAKILSKEFQKCHMASIRKQRK